MSCKISVLRDRFVGIQPAGDSRNYGRVGVVTLVGAFCSLDVGALVLFNQGDGVYFEETGTDSKDGTSIIRPFWILPESSVVAFVEKV